MYETSLKGPTRRDAVARRIAAAFAVLCLAGWLPQLSAQTQPAGGFGQAVPSNSVTSFKGKLKGINRGVVIVEKEDGSEAMVYPPDMISSFQFVAKAVPAFLKRGALVRFDATFGPGGVPIAPVKKVSLFQPVQTRSLHGRAKEQFTPGVHLDPANRGKKNQMLMGKVLVVGSLVGVSSNGILAVQAGKTPIRVPVNADTELEVRYNNTALAQPGDPVTVSGFYQPPNENQVKADRITITTDRVYGEYKPKPSSKRKRGADDSDESEDDKPEGDKPKDDKPAGTDEEKKDSPADAESDVGIKGG